MRKQTVSVSQLRAAEDILDRLRQTLAPEFLGLITTGGLTLTSRVIPDYVDADAFASLAAASFAATSQLARIMDETAFTVMFQEGKHLNVHIAQVTDDILLVVCFQKNTRIGKVRLITARAVTPLAEALGEDDPPGDEENRTEMDQAIETILGEASGNGSD